MREKIIQKTKTLGIKKGYDINNPEDWYKISVDILLDNYATTLIYKEKLHNLPKLLYPNYNWILKEFNKYKTQYVIYEIKKNIFPNEIVESNNRNTIKNPLTNKYLELDIIIKNLNFAVEYNGKQHYFYIPYFHRKKNTFEDLKNRDLAKIEECKKKNIKLLIISYYIKYENFKDYIMNFITENNIK